MVVSKEEDEFQCLSVVCVTQGLLAGGTTLAALSLVSGYIIAIPFLIKELHKT